MSLGHEILSRRSLLLRLKDDLLETDRISALIPIAERDTIEQLALRLGFSPRSYGTSRVLGECPWRELCPFPPSPDGDNDPRPLVYLLGDENWLTACCGVPGHRSSFAAAALGFSRPGEVWDPDGALELLGQHGATEQPSPAAELAALRDIAPRIARANRRPDVAERVLRNWARRHTPRVRNVDVDRLASSLLGSKP